MATKRIGAAEQAANIRFTKLARKLREAKKAQEEIKSTEPVDLMPIMYPDSENLAEDEYDKKLWYLTEMLLPLITKAPEEVYEDIYLEEEAKVLPSENVIKQNAW